MKRIAVIVITVAATLAVVAGGVASAYTVRPDLFGDGILVLRDKQAKECEEGGGCAILSKREVQQMEALIRAHASKAPVAL